MNRILPTVIWILIGFSILYMPIVPNGLILMETNPTKWVWSSDDVKVGFPREILVCDIDGGYYETVFGTTGGYLYILSIDGSEISHFVLSPSYNLTAPALGDVNGDGKEDIIVGSYNGTLYVLNKTTVEWSLVLEPPISYVALYDVDGDSKDDIIALAGGSVFIIKNNGTSVSSVTLSTGNIIGALSIGDINSDGTLEAVVTGNTSYLYLLDLATLSVTQKPLGNQRFSAPLLINLDLDPVPTLEIVLASENGYVIVLDDKLNVVWNVSLGKHIDVESIEISVGDADYDGYLDLLVPSDSYLYILSNQGSIINHIALEGTIKSTPALVDINGDHYDEIIVGSGNGNLMILRWTGEIVKQWNIAPTGVNVKILGSISVSDLEENDNGDIILLDNTGRIVTLEFQMTLGMNNYWSMYRGDEKRTGNIKTIDKDHDCVLDSIEPIIGSMDNNKWDTDGDKMPDGWEYIYNLNPSNSNDKDSDFDGDGLTNYQEFLHKTNPRDDDTDTDGMPDNWEITYGLNPRNRTDASLDPDNDGLPNLDEYNHNTNPLLNDTDKDEMPDGWEVEYNLDPTDPDDAGYDNDLDGLNNGQEYKWGTNPNEADTDGDGLSDGEEVNIGTDPTKVDTDGDGLPDGYEVEHRMNPLKKDSDGDLLDDSIDPFPANFFLPFGLIPLAIGGALAYIFRDKIKSLISRGEEAEEEEHEKSEIVKEVEEIIRK